MCQKDCDLQNSRVYGQNQAAARAVCPGRRGGASGRDFKKLRAANSPRGPKFLQHLERNSVGCSALAALSFALRRIFVTEACR